MNILFVVVVPFPFGDASSIRAYYLCKLIAMAGHSIHVISDYPSRITIDTPISFCTFEDAASKYKNGSIVSKCIRAVDNYIKKNNIDIIILNARYDRFNKIIKIAKQRNIKIIVESCEWYDSTSFKLGKLDPRYWLNEKMIRWDFKKADGFISISELLNNHNKCLGKISVRIPTILDVQHVQWNNNNEHSKLTLVYAGSLGKSKELLGPIIRVFERNEQIRHRVVFHIYGPSWEDVGRNIGSQELLKRVENCIIIHGYVPQNQVQDIMRNADYLFFMRPQRRSSNAGFPTKLGESMSVGTPIITNNTGDISKYVHSGENGFLISSNRDCDVEEILMKVINLSPKYRIEMRKRARETAEISFDYRCYLNVIRMLLDD